MSSEPSDKTATDIVPDVAIEQPRALSADAYCPKCDYNLRGLVSNHCPECGYTVTDLNALASLIPWTHRRRIGRWRAYWRTFWMVRRRMAEFCNEIGKPVSFSDAQAYRWTTVLVAWALIVVVLEGMLWALVFPAIGGVAGAAVLFYAITVPLLLGLVFALATGVPSCFFHPRRLPVHLQNRAIALSYYTSGPIVFMVVPVLLVFLIVWLNPPSLTVGAFLLIVTAAILPFAIFGVWWVDVLRMANRNLRGHLTSTLVIAIGTPILWCLIVVLAFVVIPAVFFMLLDVWTLLVS